MTRMGFDGFEVDLERRQLRRDGVPVELQEKPFTLLTALLERREETVTREELCEVLWPGVEHLDFDANLNVAVRKLRRALGDSADAPRWLVTVPGRGYRLAASPESEARPRQPSESGPVAWLALSLIGAVVLTVLLFAWRKVETDARAEKKLTGKNRATVRLAIMPLEMAEADEATRLDLARIGEWLLAEMAQPPAVDVIGPRTTAGFYGRPFPDLPRLADELDADYVLSARTLEGRGETSVLFELIRLSDFAHPWVEFHESIDDWRSLAEHARDEIRGVIEGHEASDAGQPVYDQRGLVRPAGDSSADSAFG